MHHTLRVVSSEQVAKYFPVGSSETSFTTLNSQISAYSSTGNFLTISGKFNNHNGRIVLGLETHLTKIKRPQPHKPVVRTSDTIVIRYRNRIKS
ncbi:hypothetical protein BpHYR1_045776 [Brachionus plicatilis]|uniref:Uncharacterized protein n=1 Tax=Brachionus plicatilis TaxID=10195 RepID=A0A3M7RDD2_BRAPC|nr:hypothetical protein BpHYR1_045776 [Brachionus plicatilis]